ncbi:MULTISPECIES: acetyl-CoA C-acyltransferase [Nonomuraea]|uniref:Acetyl-CoA C-acyltransferase n=1 Tax=Nonomuraea harbinensis TaxID=1286938 RepID=A0ABW1C7N8_9ACTN|nr:MULTISPECIES: acetyl-CoA C-acyltransferase [Nonomuraea]TXK40282.1 acetyl-CoA C-acyltransferase [Nonomuraea sp. C10]
MREAFIVGAVRSAVGRRRGGLSGVHPADLGAEVVAALLDRAGIAGEHVDDVVFGCVSQIGAQSTNIARVVALSAGLPESVPGTTVDRQCGSSQQAVHFAAQAVASGAQDLVVAGGVEVMSLIPIASSAIVGADAGMGMPRGGRKWAERYGDQEISQFRGAETIAAKWDVSRAAMEEFALASHQRAAAAAGAGLFAGEIVPVAGLEADEGPRPATSLEKMATLQPLVPDGRLTAATSSQISDGAAALAIASGDAVRRLGLTPLARVHSMAVVGSDPVLMLTGPIPATEAVLRRAGLKLGDIDAFEVNEAFASVVLAWQRETGAPADRVNPLGGAIALGHPLGATGARLMTTLVHHLRRNGLRYGLQTMCEGGGMANATIIEAV